MLPGTPPGEYTLDTGLYLLFGNYRLMLLAPDGRVAGDSFRLGSVCVTRPRRPPRVEELDMMRAVDASFPANGVTLLGYSQTADWVSGLDDSVAVTLFWRADDDRPAAIGRELVLVDDSGRRIWRSEGRPGGYPFSACEAGDVVRDPVVIDLRQLAGLADGRYRFAVSVMPVPAQGDIAMDPVVALGEICFEWGSVPDAGNGDGS